MATAENTLNELTRVVASIPAPARTKVLSELARDTELNPQGVTADEINKRLLTIDTGPVADIIGETRLEALLQLAKETDLGGARGAWNAEPNPSSELGRLVIELQSTAKKVFAALAQL
ncbi:MAG: hypothetical protein Q8P68_00200 [Candidatus Peregrinibacteria bacterium]|nr:hypothetical protein [Candidatus Peregrinibacteria bacterium]MDZ4244607.1 hypothetical protein [Candidatus Gracilibacteria bacterium]